MSAELDARPEPRGRRLALKSPLVVLRELRWEGRGIAISGRVCAGSGFFCLVFVGFLFVFFFPCLFRALFSVIGPESVRCNAATTTGWEASRLEPEVLPGTEMQILTSAKRKSCVRERPVPLCAGSFLSVTSPSLSLSSGAESPARNRLSAAGVRAAVVPRLALWVQIYEHPVSQAQAPP